MVFIKTVFPLLILISSLLGYFALGSIEKPVKGKPTERPLPSVEVLPLQSQKITLNLNSRGITTPATVSILNASSGGRIREMHKRLNPGGQFKKGDHLLSIEDHQHQIAVARAKSMLAEAELNLAQTLALAGQARRNRATSIKRDNSPLALYKPQIKEAQARIGLAKAELQGAFHELNQTTITAPFDGLVKNRFVNLAQNVPSGTDLIEIFSQENSEIRLPFHIHDLAKLGFSVWQDIETNSDLTIWISFSKYNQAQRIPTKLIRSEGIINDKNQLVYLVAEISDPYQLKNNNHPPIPFGKIVYATIQGKEIDPAWVIPQSALYGDSSVLIVDEKKHIRLKKVNIIESRGDTLIINQGVNNGDNLVISKSDFYVEGAIVNTVIGDSVVTVDNQHE